MNAATDGVRARGIEAMLDAEQRRLAARWLTGPSAPFTAAALRAPGALTVGVAGRGKTTLSGSLLSIRATLPVVVIDRKGEAPRPVPQVRGVTPASIRWHLMRSS